MVQPAMDPSISGNMYEDDMSKATIRYHRKFLKLMLSEFAITQQQNGDSNSDSQTRIYRSGSVESTSCLKFTSRSFYTTLSVYTLSCQHKY